MKRSLAITGAVLAVSIACLGASAWHYAKSKSALKETTSLNAELAGTQPEFLALQARVQGLEARRGLTSSTGGVAKAMEDLLTPIGLKDSIGSVKELSAGDPLESRAEFTVKDLTMNQAVNMLYAIKQAPMLLVVRDMTMRPSFQKPDLLEVKMTLSLLRAQQQ